MELPIVGKRMLQGGVILPDHPKKQQADDAKTKSNLLTNAQLSGQLAHIRFLSTNFPD